LTEIWCSERYDDMIKSELLNATDEIHWKCAKCENESD
jgi:hypothetical protein